MLLLSFVVATTVSGSPTGLQAAIRDVELELDASIYKQIVRGSPNLSTAIRLPAGFTDIECSFCRELKADQLLAAPKADAATSQIDTSVYWYYALAPNAKTLYVRPRTPGASELLSEFQTLVHIPLDTGHHFTLELRLVNLAEQETPDAVVDFVFPGKEPLRGKMAELEARLKDECRDHQRLQGLEGLASALLTAEPRNNHAPRCKEFLKGVPNVQDKLYVRMRWLCVADTLAPVAIAGFTVDNDGPLVVLQSATLEGTGVQPLTTSVAFAKTTLRNRANTSAIAVAILGQGQPLPASWRLVVTGRGDGDRQALVEGLTLD